MEQSFEGVQQLEIGGVAIKEVWAGSVQVWGATTLPPTAPPTTPPTTPPPGTVLPGIPVAHLTITATGGLIRFLIGDGADAQTTGWLPVTSSNDDIRRNLEALSRIGVNGVNLIGGPANSPGGLRLQMVGTQYTWGIQGDKMTGGSYTATVLQP